MSSTPSIPQQRKNNGKIVALAMLALWVAVLIAVYIVIVQLKLGGEEGIRLKDDAPAAQTSSE